MTTLQAVKEIQAKFDVNAIFAYRVFSLADKTNLLEDLAAHVYRFPDPLQYVSLI